MQLTRVKSHMDMYTVLVVSNMIPKKQMKTVTLLVRSINRVVDLINGTIEGLDPLVAVEESL